MFFQIKKAKEKAGIFQFCNQNKKFKEEDRCFQKSKQPRKKQNFPINQENQSFSFFFSGSFLKG